MNEINELKKIIQDHEQRISKIESLIKDKPSEGQNSLESAIPNDVLGLIAMNIDEIKTPILIAIILKFYGNLTKEKQIQILKKLGKKEAESLSGGNYNRDIVNRGLVHNVGKIGKDVLYSLTEKGRVEADKFIKQLKTKVGG